MTFSLHSKPTLRLGLELAKDHNQQFVIVDRRHVGQPVVVQQTEFDVLQHLNGDIDLQTILSHSAYNRNGLSKLELFSLCDRLESGLLLDGPAFQAFVSQPIRPPSCLGCYLPNVQTIDFQNISGMQELIHLEIGKLFTQSGKVELFQPGIEKRENTENRENKKLRAVLVPHMDFARGNQTYGFGFKRLLENTKARLFVIIGTSHYSPARFSLTRANFATPLGIVPTDQSYVDNIIRHFGDEKALFSDPVAHFPEHSIELEVVILQSILDQAKENFRIVPLLCGGYFHNENLEDVTRMIRALQLAEADANEEVVYIISGDLAHIGPKFGDELNLKDGKGFAQLTHCRNQDQRLLAALQKADADEYFSIIADEKDSRRICGLPPTYLTLLTAKAKTGEVLDYQQFVQALGYESVSFASMAFWA